MGTGRDLVARVASARLPYAENLVSGAGLAYMRLCAFLDRACSRGAIMRRASTAGAEAKTWVRGVGAASRVGGVRWRGPTRGWARVRERCAGGHVGGWATQCVLTVQV